MHAMNVSRSVTTILLADDDPNDCLFAQEAFQAGRQFNELRFVHDGDALLDYLFQRGPYAAAVTAPRPGLILLDLNMPCMDGTEALAQIKASSELRRIPVVVWTTSRSETDIRRCYDLGANSFIIKPLTFSGLVDVLDDLVHYWFELVHLPAA
jgi:CheY-like chemotaxis protein